MRGKTNFALTTPHPSTEQRYSSTPSLSAEKAEMNERKNRVYLIPLLRYTSHPPSCIREGEYFICHCEADLSAVAISLDYWHKTVIHGNSFDACRTTCSTALTLPSQNDAKVLLIALFKGLPHYKTARTRILPAP